MPATGPWPAANAGPLASPPQSAFESEVSEISITQSEINLALRNLRAWMKDEKVPKNLVSQPGGQGGRAARWRAAQSGWGVSTPRHSPPCWRGPRPRSWTRPSSGRSPSAWCLSSPPGTTL